MAFTGFSQQPIYLETKIFPAKKTQDNCCFYFQTAYLNAGAALFHAVQSILVFSLIAWLDSKPLKQRYNTITTQVPIYNASTQAIIGYENVTNRTEVDFMNKRPGVFPLFRTISIWHKIDDNKPMEFSKIRAMSSDFIIETRNLESGSVDVRYIIASFFALSCAFQILGGYFYAGKIGARLRFVEYSFSASIMIVAIGVESGIRDLYTITMMFVLIWVTQMLGLLAESLSEFSERSEMLREEPLIGIFGAWCWLVPHVAGWATCVAAYAPIIDNFHESNKASATKAPGFVNVVIYLQFALFSCFGIVQLYSLIRRTYIIQEYGSAGDSGMSLMRSSAYSNDDGAVASTKDQRLFYVADTTERVYIVLSFTAKTLLAWLILSPIMTDAID